MPQMLQLMAIARVQKSYLLGMLLYHVMDELHLKLLLLVVVAKFSDWHRISGELRFLLTLQDEKDVYRNRT